jgi:phage/plasmid primase-like uncharacterized protein/RecA-family ATPase
MVDLSKFHMDDPRSRSSPEPAMSRDQALEDFKSHLDAFGIHVAGTPIADGEIHRVPDATKNKRNDAGRYWFRELETGLCIGWMMSYIDGREKRWSSKTKSILTNEDIAATERAHQERQIKKAAEQRQAELEALATWQSAPLADQHEYLTTKGVKSHGLRIAADGSLMVPVMVDDRITSLQFITTGSKLFMTGGKVSGGSYMIGDIRKVIYLAEGYATAASIYEATGEATVAAFNAGNLMAVAQRLRERWNLPIIIAADDDRYTDGNPGKTKARAVEAAVENVTVALPIFANPQEGRTDFNDLHLHEGVEAVRRQLGQPKDDFTLEAGGVEHEPMNWATCVGDPPEREWTWDGLIPRGHITSLYADGGVGKTLISQQLATAVATAGDHGQFLGRQIRGGPVLALFAEDDEPELWRRQAAINGHGEHCMADLSRLNVLSGFGYDNLLMTFDRTSGQLTPLYHHLMGIALSVHPELIIIDNAADTFGGEEAKRAQVNQFVKVALGGLARETGAAVLLLAHPSLYGMQNKTGFSGSTAWNNAVRSRIFMEKMGKEEADFDADVRFLSLLKANYAPTGDGDQIRWKDGVFVIDNKAGGGVVSHLDAKQKCRIVLKELARIIDGGENLSPNSRAGNDVVRRLLKSEAIHKLRIRKDEIGRHLDRLQRDGLIVVETYKGNGREHQRYILTEGGEDALKNEG